MRSRPIQAAAGAGVVAAAAATLLVAPWSEDASTTPAATGAPPPATAAAAPPPDSAGTVSAPSAASPCQGAAPLDELDPARALGCPFATTTVTVTDVPTDEGVWATVTNRQPVWIHLVGRGESPIDIEGGQRLRVAGVIRTPPADPTRMGLPATGDLRAASLDFYLEVEFGDVRPAG